jgi:hypothetical protein
MLANIEIEAWKMAQTRFFVGANKNQSWAGKASGKISDQPLPLKIDHRAVIVG